ncbi:MAG: hypothetical protein ACE369_00450 [Roseovarius sp.]
MAVFERFDSSEDHEAVPAGAEQDSGNILGILVIGMVCGTAAAITAFHLDASTWTMLLAYSLVGSVSVLLVLAVQAICSSGRRKDDVSLAPRRPEGY